MWPEQRGGAGARGDESGRKDVPRLSPGVCQHLESRGVMRNQQETRRRRQKGRREPRQPWCLGSPREDVLQGSGGYIGCVCCCMAWKRRTEGNLIEPSGLLVTLIREVKVEWWGRRSRRHIGGVEGNTDPLCITGFVVQGRDTFGEVRSEQECLQHVVHRRDHSREEGMVAGAVALSRREDSALAGPPQLTRNHRREMPGL